MANHESILFYGGIAHCRSLMIMGLLLTSIVSGQAGLADSLFSDNAINLSRKQVEVVANLEMLPTTARLRLVGMNYDIINRDLISLP